MNEFNQLRSDLFDNLHSIDFNDPILGEKNVFNYLNSINESHKYFKHLSKFSSNLEQLQSVFNYKNKNNF